MFWEPQKTNKRPLIFERNRLLEPWIQCRSGRFEARRFEGHGLKGEPPKNGLKLEGNLAMGQKESPSDHRLWVFISYQQVCLGARDF